MNKNTYDKRNLDSEIYDKLSHAEAIADNSNETYSAEDVLESIKDTIKRTCSET